MRKKGRQFLGENRGDTTELTVMTKKVVIFSEKIGVTPPVDAPGDTNRDVTGTAAYLRAVH